MNRTEFDAVLLKAAAEKGCMVVEVVFDDDENVFEVTIDKEDGTPVEIDDCEFVHRAILDAFDRTVEDYSLTISSVGLSPEEADTLLASDK